MTNAEGTTTVDRVLEGLEPLADPEVAAAAGLGRVGPLVDEDEAVLMVQNHCGPFQSRQ